MLASRPVKGKTGGRKIPAPSRKRDGDSAGTIRSFIAIELEASARERLTDLQTQLRRSLCDEPIRWVRPESVHLTVKFLGGQSAPVLQGVGRTLEAAVKDLEGFPFSIVGAGCFPNASNPRVIWAGIQETTGRLAALVRGIESSLSSLGIESERRPFEPHLTLGRVKDRLGPDGRRHLEEQLTLLGSVTIAECRAGSVDLMRSDLRPDGAVYTILTRARFAVEASR